MELSTMKDLVVCSNFFRRCGLLPNRTSSICFLRCDWQNYIQIEDAFCQVFFGERDLSLVLYSWRSTSGKVRVVIRTTQTF